MVKANDYKTNEQHFNVSDLWCNRPWSNTFDTMIVYKEWAFLTNHPSTWLPVLLLMHAYTPLPTFEVLPIYKPW